MDLKECLDVLITSGAPNEKLREATNLLSEAPTNEVIEKLCAVAFNQADDISRREAALVLLRPRLIIWNGEESSQLYSEIQEQLLRELSTNDGDQNPFSWRLISVISGLICAQNEESEESEKRWKRLINGTVSFIEDASKSNNVETNQRALLLMSTIYNDGGSEMFRFNPYLAAILERSLTSQSEDLRNKACKAAASLLKWYALKSRKENIPSGCFALFRHLIDRLASTVSGGDLTNALNILDSLTSIVDVDIDGEGLWDLASAQKICQLLPRVRGDIWFGSANSLGVTLQDLVTVTQSILHLATDAWISLFSEHCSAEGEESFKSLWLILVEHLSVLFPPCECSETDLILLWELDLQDDDDAEFVLKRELPDESIDLGWTAWDEMATLIEALRESNLNLIRDKIFLLTLNGATSASSSVPYYTSEYARWMILSLLAQSTAGSSLFTKARLAQIFEIWQDYILTDAQKGLESRERNLNYAIIRSRWAALTFMEQLLVNELLPIDVYGTKLFQALKISISSEVVPRNQAKAYSTLCHLGTELAEIGRGDLGFIHLLREFFNTWLLPSLTKDDNLIFTVTDHPVDPTCVEARSLFVLLKKYLLATISTFILALGQGLREYYNPLMNQSLNLIKQVPTNSHATDLSEEIVELAGRLVECVGLIQFEDPESIPTEFERVEEDACSLIEQVIRLERVADEFIRSGAACGSSVKTKGGIQSTSFQSTLLQATARAVGVLDTDQHRNQIRSILPLVAQRFQAVDAVTVSAGVLDQPLGVRGYKFETSENNTKVIVAQPKGLQKTININSSLVAEQLNGLSFFKSVAEKLLLVTTHEEILTLVVGAERLIASSPLRDIHKIGFEALAAVLSVWGSKLNDSIMAIVTTFQRLPTIEDANFKAAMSLYLSGLLRFIDLAFSIFKHMYPRQIGIQDITYSLVDMIDTAKEVAVMLGTSLVPYLPPEWPEAKLVKMLDIWYEFYNALLIAGHSSLFPDNVQPTDNDPNEDDEENEDNDVSGVTCDAILQFTYRMLKMFGKMSIPVFEKSGLKAFYSLLLTVDDVSIVSRTAALVLFANYVDVMGIESQKLCAQLIGVSCLYAQPGEVNSNLVPLLKKVIPSLDRVHDTFDDDLASNPIPDLELLQPCVDELRKIDPESNEKDDSEVIEDFISEQQGEVMRIQAACFCIGSAALYCPIDELIPLLPQITDRFMALLEHPLAGLSRRRVILDCLACAAIKIYTRLHNLYQTQYTSLFSAEGLLKVLKYLLPLRDDAEDAQICHDIIINWVSDTPQPGLPRLPPLKLSENNCGLTNGQSSDDSKTRIIFAREAARILSVLNDEKAKELVSQQSRYLNRLNAAIAVLEG